MLCSPASSPSTPSWNTSWIPSPRTVFTLPEVGTTSRLRPGRSREVVPTSGNVNTVLGEGIHEVFHDGVDGDDAGEQSIEISPCTGTAEPAVEHDGEQNQVLSHGEKLVGWPI